MVEEDGRATDPPGAALMQRAFPFLATVAVRDPRDGGPVVALRKVAAG